METKLICPYCGRSVSSCEGEQMIRRWTLQTEADGRIVASGPRLGPESVDVEEARPGPDRWVMFDKHVLV
jgi:hypothetical protein